MKRNIRYFINLCLFLFLALIIFSYIVTINTCVSTIRHYYLPTIDFIYIDNILIIIFLILILIISYIFIILLKNTIILIVLIFVSNGMFVDCYKEKMIYRKLDFHRVETEIMQNIIDAEVKYTATHLGRFYIDNDFNKIKKVLNLDIDYLQDSNFECNIKVGETTILIRVNKKGKNYYIYRFYPEKNSDKIKGYNKDYWDDGFYGMDYLNYLHTDIDLQNDGEVVSTY